MFVLKACWGPDVCLFIPSLNLFQQAVNNNFPFSVHDNRHSLQSSGCYLDSVSIALQVTSATGSAPGRHSEGQGLSSKFGTRSKLMPRNMLKKKCTNLSKFCSTFCTRKLSPSMFAFTSYFKTCLLINCLVHESLVKICPGKEGLPVCLW